MSLLRLENVHAGYGDADVLHGISLHVEPSEVVVMIGPNGAGKSTAIKAIFGLIRVRTGTVRFRDEEIQNTTPSLITARGLCYVPQNRSVFPSLTVEENLEMGAYLRREGTAAAKERVYGLFPALREKRRQAAGSLSGGQAQMVAIGRALMLDPDLLLLDEPTAGLSPRFMDQIFRIVADVNANGVAVLMVEQNARQALAMADRGYVLAQGANRFQGTGRELLADPEVRASFLGG